ncbi:hypothetical protein ACOSQ4_000839 [Xanthoceras sorbifolium]
MRGGCCPSVGRKTDLVSRSRVFNPTGVVDVHVKRGVEEGDVKWSLPIIPIISLTKYWPLKNGCSPVHRPGA